MRNIHKIESFVKLIFKNIKYKKCYGYYKLLNDLAN